MEEERAYGQAMMVVIAFVVFLVGIMSYSLWRDKQINAFMATNLARGIQCDRQSRAAWVVRAGERVTLEMNQQTLYCSGYRFEARDDAGKTAHLLDKYTVYQHLSRLPL